MNNFMRFFNKNQKNIFLATAVVIFMILIKKIIYSKNKKVQIIF